MNGTFRFEKGLIRYVCTFYCLFRSSLAIAKIPTPIQHPLFVKITGITIGDNQEMRGRLWSIIGVDPSSIMNEATELSDCTNIANRYLFFGRFKPILDKVSTPIVQHLC